MNQFAALLVACIIAFVAAECPSACSGHGTCGAYDACTCFRNWMSNDCSERICPFGLAHVDTPMGDLDSSSGILTGPGTTAAPGAAGDLSIIVNDAVYPSGTTEQFPAMKDTAGTIVANSAHYYRECSNKGICDRSSGECECFDGYDGSSCQRASCPSSANGVCSGHGTCKTIQELAAGEGQNIYRLWDEDITMGCDCDSGYNGADCASRNCKVGVDPLYSDDFANVRHANYTLQFYIMNDDAEIYGNYSLVFTDVYGEDWQTEPIDIDASCAVIQDRLESIPNDVIPYGTVKCYKSEELLHVAADVTTQPGALGFGGVLVFGADKLLTLATGGTAVTLGTAATYTNVALTGDGTCAGAKATVTLSDATTISSISVTNGGTGCAVGDILTIAAADLGSGSTAVTFGALTATEIRSTNGKIAVGTNALLALATGGNAVTNGLLALKTTKDTLLTLATTGIAGDLLTLATTGATTAVTGGTAGTYTNVALTGGSCAGAKATVTLTDATTISSIIVTTGATECVAADVLTIAAAALGSGSTEVTFAGLTANEIPTLTETVTFATAGTYTNVALTATVVGACVGAKATVVVSDYNTISSITVTTAGSKCAAADVLTIAAADLGVSSTLVTFGALTASELDSFTYYGVALTGDNTCAGAEATVTLSDATTISKIIVTNGGTGLCKAGDVLTIAGADLGSTSTAVTFTALTTQELQYAGVIGGNTNDPAKSGQKALESVRTFDNAPQYSTESATVGELIYSAFNYSVVNKFVLAFPGNPGEVPPIKVNRFLDGKRPTLFSTEKELQTLGVHIYANGFHGESTDYVNDECEGVLVGLASDQVQNAANTAIDDTAEKISHYLKIESNLEFERLKRCLGDSDGITNNNIEVYDWDYGNFMNPHLIKLVDATQDRFTEYVRADGTSYKVLAHGDTPIGEGEAWETFPMTKLCSRGQPWLKDNYELSDANHNLLFQDDLNDATSSGGAIYNRGTHGWCKNPNPPGFFAIIYFDDCSAEGVTAQSTYHAATNTDSVSGTPQLQLDGCSTNMKGFRVLTRAALDYASDTKFHVYTTKGTLQQVSQHSGAYTANYAEKFNEHDGSHKYGTLNPDFIHNFHSRTIHVANTTFTGAQGQIDCETAPVGTYGNFDCLNKGDKIFLLNLGDRQALSCEPSRTSTNIAGGTIGTGDSCFYKSTPLSFDSNPLYPNMYTVEKIGKAIKNPNEADSRYKFWADPTSEITSDHNSIHHEGYRHQITLNMGVNGQYMSNLAGNRAATAGLENEEITPDLKATIYKFHPPTLATTGTTGYNYVGECSNRGICNTDDGMCECFAGYTSDNCGVINSLAQ